MKKTILYFTILIFLLQLNTIFADESKESNNRLWSQGTAHLLPKGRMEVGFFQPLRYGWSDKLEFSTQPLVNILMPNMSVKWSHKSVAGFFISTRHSFYYPTPLLRVISREGIGGMISPEFNIPHMISLYNEILFSKQIAKNLLFNGKAGFAFALKSGDLDSRSTIDLPLIFPRLAVFYNGYGFRFGADMEGKLFKRWLYLVDADVFYAPGQNENFAFENKGLILWTKSDRFQLTIGYKLSYAEYPFGTQWHLLLPIFDFQWAWQLK